MIHILAEIVPEDAVGYSLIGPALWVCFALLVVTFVLSVGLPLIGAIKNPQGLVKALVGVVGLVVLFGIAYSLSGSEVSAKAASYGTTAASSKWIGAGLITFYIALLVSTVLAIVSLIRDIISG
jgi:hypothetical protein